MILALLAQPASAQERTVSIARFGQIEISASSRGGVFLEGSDGVNAVSVFLTPQESVAWADSAEELANRRVPVPPRGEKNEYQVEPLILPRGSLTFERTLERGRDWFDISIADKYVVNFLSISLTRSEARRFVNAIRRAAAKVDSLRTVPGTAE